MVLNSLLTRSQIKVLVLLVLSFLFSSCEKQKDANVIIVGTSADYPPYEYISESKEISGIDVEISKIIAEKLSKKIEIKNIDFAGLIPAIKINDVDMAISAISKTPERENEIDFSRSYYSAKFAVVYNNENADKAKFSEMIIKSKLNSSKIYGSIGCQSGSSMEIYMRSLYTKESKNSDIVPFEVKSYPSNLNMISLLIGGSLDFVLMDSLVAKAFVLKNPSLSQVELSEPKFEFGIVLPKNSILTKDVNKALDEIIKKKEIAKIEKRVIDKIASEIKTVE